MARWPLWSRISTRQSMHRKQNLMTHSYKKRWRCSNASLWFGAFDPIKWCRSSRSSSVSRLAKSSDEPSLAKEAADVASIVFHAYTSPCRFGCHRLRRLYCGLANVASIVSGAHTSASPIWLHSSLTLILPPRRFRFKMEARFLAIKETCSLEWRNNVFLSVGNNNSSQHSSY